MNKKVLIAALAMLCAAAQLRADSGGLDFVHELMLADRGQNADAPQPPQPVYLPSGRMDATPNMFTVAQKRGQWIYPSDGRETVLLILPENGADTLTVHYQWLPNACSGSAAQQPECMSAMIITRVSFPALTVDRAAGVVRLPQNYPGAARGAVIGQVIKDSGLASARVQLLDGYKLDLVPAFDKGDEAYLHCRYDDDAGKWTGCDNKPDIPTVHVSAYLTGPGLAD
jgi:hypothetical protein